MQKFTLHAPYCTRVTSLSCAVRPIKRTFASAPVQRYKTRASSRQGSNQDLTRVDQLRNYQEVNQFYNKYRVVCDDKVFI